MKKAGIIIGIGLGGFFDGIVFHQILQWHNMLSAIIPPHNMPNMKYNMLWDGMFHALVWMFTLAGIMMLFKSKKAGRMETTVSFIGSMIFGWGLFNLIEGGINHLLLGIHHVRETASYLVYDMVFITAGGILLMLVGWFMMKKRTVQEE